MPGEKLLSAVCCARGVTQCIVQDVRRLIITLPANRAGKVVAGLRLHKAGLIPCGRACPPRCRLPLGSAVPWPRCGTGCCSGTAFRPPPPSFPVAFGAPLGSAVPGYEVKIEVRVTQRVLVGQLGSLHGG